MPNLLKSALYDPDSGRQVYDISDVKSGNMQQAAELHGQSKSPAIRMNYTDPTGKQAVGFHIPQHLAAVLQYRLHGVILRSELGILLFEQGIQLLLVFQQGSVQVRHRRGPGFLRLCLRLGGAAKARPAPCTEHTVHKVFPIVGICHGLPSVFVVFFQYSVPGQVLQFPLEKSTPVVYTYCMENKKKE